MTNRIEDARLPSASGQPRLRGYAAMGGRIVTDFPFRRLPETKVAEADVCVVEIDGAFPPLGEPSGEFPCAGRFAPPLVAYESDDGLQWEADGLGRFWVEPSGSRVLYRLADGASFDDVDEALTGPVLGSAFQSRGAALLCASAVALNGAAVFVGAERSTATLARSLAREGAVLLSLGVLPLTAGEGDGPFVALPNVSPDDLQDDSATAAERSYHGRVLSLIERRRAKSGAHMGPVATEPAPLAAIYLLSPHDDAVEEIEIDDAAPMDAALSLFAAMYLSGTMGERRAVASRAAAMRLAVNVAIREVAYPRGWEGRGELRRAIVEDAVRRAPV